MTLEKMRLLTFLDFTLLLFLPASVVTARSAPNSNKAVLLSNIQSLTLHGGKQTSHRRVPAAEQLKCVGGSGRGKFQIDTMRCTNQGSSYSAADVEWSCTASLPPEFKLGSTNVVCEGYRDSEDEWVLKGSCGVEYRLVLTDLGWKKFGGTGSWWSGTANDSSDGWFGTLFWIIFVGIGLFMLYGYCTQQQQNRRPHGTARRTPRGGGGGGGGGPGFRGGRGGGGGFPSDSDDPPPPYSPQPPPKPKSTSSQGWQSSLWTAGAAAAAGYAAGRYTGGGSGGSSWGSGRRRDDPGEGSSMSSQRYTSTGFGSTSRR